MDPLKTKKKQNKKQTNKKPKTTPKNKQKHTILCENSKLEHQLEGVVGCGKGVAYYIQLILASSWARPAILVELPVRVEGECFYFFCFFTVIPVPFSLSSPLLSLSPFLWEMTLLSLSLSLGDDTE